MRTNNHHTIILTLSFPLAILVIVAGYAGLWIPETYSQETVNWTAQATSHTIPKNIIQIGMPTNPVHVLDLSVCLPGLMITSILLFKKNH